MSSAAVRAALVGAAWLAALAVVRATIEGDAEVYVGVALTFAAGALAGTWWVLLAPAAGALALLVFDPINPCDDCRDELGLLGTALLLTGVAVLAVAVLALGVGSRRGLARTRGA